ncbi:hypothetical protein VTK56DRAFT_1000 [Thermocarpiscus australiensis]
MSKSFCAFRQDRPLWLYSGSAKESGKSAQEERNQFTSRNCCCSRPKNGQLADIVPIPAVEKRFDVSKEWSGRQSTYCRYVPSHHPPFSPPRAAEPEATTGERDRGNTASIRIFGDREIAGDSTYDPNHIGFWEPLVGSQRQLVSQPVSLKRTRTDSNF